MRSRKYRNKPIKVGDDRFDSRGELQRWCDLVLLEQAGEISDLRRQVPLSLGVRYDNGREAKLIVDFAYVQDGVQRWEDYKGLETSTSKLKRAILRSKGIDIFLTRG